MKTDAELKKDVIAELNWDPAVESDAIGVAVKDGIVTVSGHLDTYAQRFAVERALQRVHGVKAIALELDVKLSPQHKRSDTEIAEAVEQTLKRITLSANRESGLPSKVALSLYMASWIGNTSGKASKERFGRCSAWLQLATKSR